MTPEEIARVISGERKRALMWLPDKGGRNLGEHPPSISAREWLRAMGLMTAPTPSIRALTPLGQHVRAILAADAAQPNDRGD